MRTASILLFVIACLGAFGVAWFHNLKGRLREHAESRLEVLVHACRGIIYFLQMAIVPNLQFHGAFFALFVALYVADIAIAWFDVWIEPDSRRAQGGLPRGEYFMHIVLRACA